MPLLRHPLSCSLPSLPSFALAALLVSGCGTLLGLDEFTDAADAGSGGGSGAPCERAEVRACYEGASRTERVGVCAPGTQACGEDGRWGVCEGQVLPGEEDCDRRGDEDCDGVGCSDVAWAKMSSPGILRWATSVAISPRGDRIALAGIYAGELDFGSSAATSLPEQAEGGVFLAVFDGDGNYLHGLGLPSHEGAPAVALDAESNVLFTALYQGTANLGGEDLPASGTTDMLVAKLDANGGHVWSKQFGGPDSQHTQPIDMAVTPDGDAVITGGFTGSVIFGGPTLEAADASDRDGFLVRLSGGDGSHVYSVHIGDDTSKTPDEQWGRGVGVDAMGRAVVAGTFASSITLAGDTHVSSSMGESGWIAQYDPEGTLLWNTFLTHGEGSTVELVGVDVDPAGNAGIAGNFSGAITIHGTNILADVTRETTGAQDVDLLVLRLSASGTHSWSKQIGDTTDQRWALPYQGVALDSEGELVLAGGFRGRVNFGGEELSANDDDWFVAKFDFSGNHRWSHRYGSGAAFQGVSSAAIHPETREIVVAGVSDGTIDLVEPTLTTDNFSVVIARMSP